jgi:hypothetical protein
LGCAKIVEIKICFLWCLLNVGLLARVLIGCSYFISPWCGACRSLVVKGGVGGEVLGCH